jgi:hypothetical protein
MVWIYTNGLAHKYTHNPHKLIHTHTHMQAKKLIEGAGGTAKLGYYNKHISKHTHNTQTCMYAHTCRPRS